MKEAIKDFIARVQKALNQKQFLKLQFSAALKDPDLRRLIIRPVLIKQQQLLCFTYQKKRQDLHKNFDQQTALGLIIDFLESDFKYARLYTAQFDLEIELLANGKWRTKETDSSASPTELQHDRQKIRAVAEDSAYLKILGIASEQGKVISSKYDKYRQLDKFIQIFSDHLSQIRVDKKQAFKVVDYGSGKNYLTFAIYEFLAQQGFIKPQLTGVEIRPDLVKQGQEFADKLGFSGLNFICGNIASHKVSKPNVVVALHACDTASDDALAAAILEQADLVIVAPCCHKYLRGKLSLPIHMNYGFRHGILEERLAVLLTDSLRALALEASGYIAKVFEFISSEHTDKNVMITAIRCPNSKSKQNALQQLQELRQVFQFDDFYLDKVLNLSYKFEN